VGYSAAYAVAEDNLRLGNTVIGDSVSRQSHRTGSWISPLRWDVLGNPKDQNDPANSATLFFTFWRATRQSKPFEKPF
jgi:hypothetical protein